MGKINRKAVKAVKTKGAAPAVADNKASKVSKRSIDVIPLGGVKKTTTAPAKLRKKDRVKVKKQHLLLKLQGCHLVGKLVVHNNASPIS